MISRITTSTEVRYVKETPQQLDSLWQSEGDWLMTHDHETGDPVALQRRHIISIEGYPDD